MRRPAAALFDLDGTLVDREPLMGEALRRACAGAGVDVPTETLAATVGRAWPDVYERLAVSRRAGWSFDRFMARVHAEADRLTADGWPVAVLDGGVDLLARLHGHGVPTGIVTGSTRRELDAVVADLGLGGVLTTTLAAEDYRDGKPAPDGFLRAAARLGVAPGDCVVFEDSEVGVAAARVAGMRVVATAAANPPPGHPAHQDLSGAHRTVRSLAEVDDALLAGLLEARRPGE